MVASHGNGFNASFEKAGKNSHKVLEDEFSKDSSTIEKPVPLTPEQQALENRLQNTLNLIQLGIIDPREGPIVLSTGFDPNENNKESGSVSRTNMVCIVFIVLILMTLCAVGFIYLFGELVLLYYHLSS